MFYNLGPFRPLLESWGEKPGRFILRSLGSLFTEPLFTESRGEALKNV